MGLDDDKEPRTPLTSVDLRNNKLKGSIVLGNYEVSSVYQKFNLLQSFQTPKKKNQFSYFFPSEKLENLDLQKN